MSYFITAALNMNESTFNYKGGRRKFNVANRAAVVDLSPLESFSFCTRGRQFDAAMICCLVFFPAHACLHLELIDVVG